MSSLNGERNNDLLVSVIMGVFNESANIISSVKSIQDQSYDSWELIIIDDASTDNTVELVENLKEKDERITLLRNSKNLGLAATLNKGISVARGEYIARMDGDDWSRPDRFSKQVEFLERRPDIDILGSGALISGADGQIVSEILLPETHEKIVGRNFLKTLFFHPSVMIRRRFFERVGRYDDNLVRSQDKELWIRGLKMGARYHNLQESLIKYSARGYIRSWSAIIKSINALYYIVRKHKIDNGMFWVLVALLIDVTQKMRLRTPRSLRIGKVIR